MRKPREKRIALLAVCTDCGDVKKTRYKLVDGMPREVETNNKYWISKRYCPGSVNRLMKALTGNYTHSVCPDCQEARNNGELK